MNIPKNTYSTIGYKSIGEKILFVLLGLAFLGALNLILFGLFHIIVILGVVFCGIWLYNKIILYRNTRYTFDKDHLRITTKHKKSYTIPYDDIEKITLEKVSRFSGQGGAGVVKYNTSDEHVLAIHLKNNTVIHISPRTIKPRVRQKFGL